MAQRSSKYPAEVFDGFSTGNRDRDSREDDVQPDFHDADQIFAEIIALQTVGGPSGPSGPTGPSGPSGPTGPAVASYLPADAPANGANYSLAVDANGVVSWVSA